MRIELAFAAIAFLYSGTGAEAVCDPNGAQNDRTQQLNRSGKYAEAAAAARLVIEHDPDDFRAHYQLGQALLAQSVSSGNKDAFDAGMKELLAAEPMLRKQDMACVRTKGWYSIYATLGYYDYVHGDLANAEKWLAVARSNFDKLGPEWQQRTLQYSAVLAFRKGDLTRAGQFSEQAAAAGATSAAKLSRAVQTIQDGAR